MQATAAAAAADLPHPPSHSAAAATANRIPSIRLITATPSTTCISSSDGGNSSTSTSSAAFARSLEDSWEASTAAAAGSTTSLALAPKGQETTATGKKRLVPKKSKLGMGIFSSTPFTSSSSLSSGSGSIKPPVNSDLSDVVRRVGVELPSSSTSASASAAAAAAASLKAKGGFEIYVDPTVDPDIGEILVVKKRPSRVRGGLGGVGWGMESGGAATEVPPVPNKGQPMGEKTNLGGGGGRGDEKEGGKERWWTIGRGRKDSKEDKEKKKGKENNKMSSSLKRMFFFFFLSVWFRC